MILEPTKLLEAAGVFLAGAGITWWAMRSRDKVLGQAREIEQRNLLENARREADSLLREAKLHSAELVVTQRAEIEKEFTSREQVLEEAARRLAQREELVNTRLETLTSREKRLNQEEETVSKEKQRLTVRANEVEEIALRRREALQRTAHLTEQEARDMLLKEVETDCIRQANELARNLLDSARARAEEQARRILSIAIQRYAAPHTFETTTSTVQIEGDEIKGRIIGREGRNIRTFENATGITVMIDDTPNAVVLSGYDPVRREIAREAMRRLVEDGRIHPTRIEEVVVKVREEIDEAIVRFGEEAVATLTLPPLHLEVTKKLGALKFRTSFSQNVLSHSIEVAQLMSMMASEMGLDPVVARRCGLLHDIGKSMDHEIEGTHAIIGADFVRNHGETDEVVNAVASHHGEVPHANPYGILVSAADAISASRPGARSETMTTYIKRVENLERIAASFPGVERAFAIQAGRELRIMVRPAEVDDDQAAAMARNIVRKIEEDLQYPGQIRVTVMRETRCVEYAK